MSTEANISPIEAVCKPDSRNAVDTDETWRTAEAAAASGDPKKSGAEQGKAKLLADRQQVKQFIEVLFRHADPGSYVSLRAFHQFDDNAPPLFVHAISLQDPVLLLAKVCWSIERAANHSEPYVFSPPVCTFKTRANAKETNLADGPALSVECDSYPVAARATLGAVLGTPTVVVASGGLWLPPSKPEVQEPEAPEPKVHAHWRLKKPARTAEEHAALKEARLLAACLVGADTSAGPTVHPLRWPGSWHRKTSPPILVTITELNPDIEIDLYDARDRLRAACLAAGIAAPSTADHGPSEPQAPLNEIQAALLAIQNDDLEWAYWNRIGMAIWAATGGDDEGGLEAFHAWSAKSCKYVPTQTIDRWEHYRGSPPTKIGAGTLFWEARQADPSWRDSIVDEMDGFTKQHEQPQGDAGADAAEGDKASPPVTSLEEVHRVFRKWLGNEYDLDAINAVLAAAASERLKGDPLWLLLISGPGATKTETVQSLKDIHGVHITSTIASEGALLSGSSKKERTKKSTGGLLRKIGTRGVLVIKDVTSILSADRNTRASVLAAVREIYDGRWERNVGTDGGQTLTWEGRIALIGAVTTSWDTAHAVVAAMGDRFVLLRIDSNIGRKVSGTRAIRNTGDEIQMRAELAAAVAGLVHHACTDEVAITEAELEGIVNVADIVTMARTAVERDYRGDVIDAHAPEMPTRFAKQLTQMIRGAVAIGMTRQEAMRLAIRCARDSIPPLRLAILLDVAQVPDSRVGDVRKRIDKPWITVRRELEALHMLGMLRCDEEETELAAIEDARRRTIWRYRLAEGFDRATLLAMAGVAPHG